MHQQAENKGLKFTFTHDINPSILYTGDDFRIKQILYNLIGNAIKFTSKGHVSFEVETHPQNCFVFIISDTGPGISQADVERIFNEFEQTDFSTNKYGGTGLGLS